MTKRKQPYYSNSIINPIHQTATYYFESTQEVIEYHEGEAEVGRYGRYDNPSWLAVEAQLAALDQAETALLFPSGMSAITSTFMTFLSAGEKIVFTGKGYRNVRSLCYEYPDKFGVEAVSLPLLDSEDVYTQLADECSPNLKFVFLETPSNPHMFLIDVARVRQIVGPDCLIMVDSTFSSPINFQPLAYGADLVIHSCAKYLGGHGDIMAGSVAGTHELVGQLRRTRNVTGAIADPNTAFLLTRSLETLKVRMAYANEAGQQLAEYLQDHPLIGRVLYTGLPTHPHHKIADEMLSGHGGVVTFEVLADEPTVSKVVDSLTVPYMGTNFGSSHSMVEQLGLFTYYKQSEEEREDLGITDNLIRYSIGHSDSLDEIIADIDQALSALLKQSSCAQLQKQDVVEVA
ncbi:MAG: aminotransferase class I/II-fold pyridoxal phosphate-dependent enzyme [Chloroflexota bacterium]